MPCKLRFHQPYQLFERTLSFVSTRTWVRCLGPSVAQDSVDGQIQGSHPEYLTFCCWMLLILTPQRTSRHESFGFLIFVQVLYQIDAFVLPSRCGPCKLMYPKLVEAADKYDQAVFIKLDCNQENKVSCPTAASIVSASDSSKVSCSHHIAAEKVITQDPSMER